MFKSKNYYVLWTVSICTTSLHSKFCKIDSLVRMYKNDMDELSVTYYFALVATPGLKGTK